MSPQEEIIEMINHWCPAQFRDEPFSNQILRALMCANACALDLQRVVNGAAPIRPLDSYPERKV